MSHEAAKNIKLKNMRPGEETMMLVKRHWIILVKLGLFFALGFIITILIYAFVANAWTHLGVVIFWMMYSIFLYISWLDHELDMYVITNNRIIGVEQISFLNRRVSECNLGQVQEVGSHTKGLLGNLLNYSTVKISTAGNGRNFSMTYCPEALDNSRSILNIVDHYRDTHGGKNKI